MGLLQVSESINDLDSENASDTPFVNIANADWSVEEN